MRQVIASPEEALLGSEPLEEAIAGLMQAAEKGELVACPPGGEIRFSGLVASMLAQLLAAVASGEQVFLGTVPALLSPEDAAQVLGLSRPYVYRLIDRGVFPHVIQDEGSTHRKLLLSDVLAYEEARMRSVAAADALAERAQREPMVEDRSLAALARDAARSGDRSELKAELARRRVGRVQRGVAAADAARDSASAS